MLIFGTNRKHWILICFINFFIASLMGLLLRWMYVAPIEGVNFQFLMHGHSHVAMLGWVYLMLYCLIFHFFVPKEAQQKPIYNRLFWVTELAVVGMMIDFPAQGYAFVSILFSTLHIFCSYYFCYLIWKDAKPATFPEKRMLRTALFFMVFSTLGVWCLGPAVGIMGKASAFYQIAIQFFLHFQFNGWFLFAVLALFFKQSKLNIDEKKFRLFYNLFVIGNGINIGFACELVTFQSYFLLDKCNWSYNPIIFGSAFYTAYSTSISKFLCSSLFIRKNCLPICFIFISLKSHHSIGCFGSRTGTGIP